MPNTRLDRPCQLDRTPKTKSADPPQIDMSGGDFNAGIIRNVSVIAAGEALGHEMFIDEIFVAQVADHINAAGETGIKSRFTHPSLSADGLGRFLGRLKNAEVSPDGKRTLADLHLAKSAHDTPDGNLAEYVANLAAEDSKAFGLSIAFTHDAAAEDEFCKSNLNENGDFVSPSENNPANYYHARLRTLRAGDVVDEPAANPDGLFHRQAELAADADALLDFALGQSEKAPALSTSLDVHPERLRGFVEKYLERRKLEVLHVAEPVEADEVVETPATMAELSTALPAADDAFYVAMLRDGVTVAAAVSKWHEQLSEKLRVATEEIGRLKEEIAVLRESEAAPVSFSAEPAETADKVTGPAGRLGERVSRYAESLRLNNAARN